MKAWEIIAWTYDADIHCLACARERFGAALDNGSDSDHPGPVPLDSESNEIHPVFASDETDPAGEYCGDCGAEISEPEDAPPFSGLTVTVKHFDGTEHTITIGPDQGYQQFGADTEHLSRAVGLAEAIAEAFYEENEAGGCA